MATPSLDMERIRATVEQRYSILKVLFDLSRRQMACVEADDIEGLLEILACKQRVLAQFQVVHEQWKSLAAGLQMQQQNLPESIMDRLGECQRMFEELMAYEQKSAEIVAERRNQIGQELQQLGAFSQAHAAYSASGGAGTGQLDIVS